MGFAILFVFIWYIYEADRAAKVKKAMVVAYNRGRSDVEKGYPNRFPLGDFDHEVIPDEEKK